MPARGQSPTLFPDHHVRALVDLLRFAGADLGRRWVAALLLAPEEDRAALVQAVEARIAAMYPDQRAPQASASNGSSKPAAPAQGREREFVIVYPSRQRPGHVESVERTYAVVEPKGRRAVPRNRKRA